jgi:hypothetical protein
LSQQRLRNQPNDTFEQFSRDLIRWIVGPGLLSVHMCAFFLTMVTLLLWNYSREPADLWVAEPLRRWGLVVVFHAVAVAVGTAAWRLMRMGQPAPVPPAEPELLEFWQPKEHRAQPADTYLAERAEHASASARAEEWARRWLRESRKVVRDAAGTHTEPYDHVPPPPRDLSQMTAEAEESARSGFGKRAFGAFSAAAEESARSGFGKRAFGAFSAARERVRPHANGVHEPNGVDAVRTWPASSEPEVPADEIEQQLEWTSGTWAFTPPSDSPAPFEVMEEESDWPPSDSSAETRTTEDPDPDDPARA